MSVLVRGAPRRCYEASGVNRQAAPPAVWVPLSAAPALDLLSTIASSLRSTYPSWVLKIGGVVQLLRVLPHREGGWLACVLSTTATDYAGDERIETLQPANLGFVVENEYSNM